MGYWYTTDDDHLESWYLYHRGYPGCSSSDAPVGCVSQTQWAQKPNCAAYDSGTLEFDFSCDTSAGHCGGPVYSWQPGSQGPYIVGINSASHSCKAPSCTEVDPNSARRITKHLAGKMSFVKSVEEWGP
jgi:hypothetical protein